MRVSEIRVNQIRVNQGLGVLSKSFFCVKNWLNLSEKKSMKNIRLGDQFLSKNVFENFDFWDTLFSEIVPNFCWLCS